MFSHSIKVYQMLFKFEIPAFKEREKPGSLAKHSLPKWKGLTKKIQGSLNTEKSRWDCKRKAYKSMRLLFSRVTNGRVAFLYCR